jgi:hypothetical protein
MSNIKLLENGLSNLSYILRKHKFQLGDNLPPS